MLRFLRRSVRNEPREAPAQPPRRYFYLGDHTALTELHDGQAIFVDTRDLSLTPYLLWNGRWENWVDEAFTSAVRPGMVVLDVGANYGYFTLIAARLVTGSGRVFAVEANPRIAQLLRRSVAVNGRSKFF